VLAKIPEEAVMTLNEVALDSKKGSNESVKLFATVDEQKLLVCTLRGDAIPQHALDLAFFHDQQVRFSVEGTGDIHLLGSLAPMGPEDGSDFDDDEFDEEGEEIDGDEDEDEEEEHEEKANGLPVKPKGPGKHPRVKEVSQLEDGDEDEADVPKNVKKQKSTPSKGGDFACSTCHRTFSTEAGRRDHQVTHKTTDGAAAATTPAASKSVVKAPKTPQTPGIAGAQKKGNNTPQHAPTPKSNKKTGQ